MLFKEKKNKLWLIQFSKGLKFWKKTHDSVFEWTLTEWLEIARPAVRRSGAHILGVKALTKEQYDYYVKKGF